MKSAPSIPATRVLLSFSSAYSELARRLAGDLQRAGLAVRLNQWEDGGQGINPPLEGVHFILPLLSPSNATANWIGEAWKRRVFDRAQAGGLPVLPVRGALGQIPDFLQAFSFADLCNRDYRLEVSRLIRTIKAQSGNEAIRLPKWEDALPQAALSPRPSEHPLVAELAADLAFMLEDAPARAMLEEQMLPMMYDGLFYELGVPIPKVHLRTNHELPSATVQILINDIPEKQWALRPGYVLVNEQVEALSWEAEPAINPASGHRQAWIPERFRAEAEARGLSTWDNYGIIILALSSVLRRKAANFITTTEVRRMLSQIRPVFGQLVEETVPRLIPYFGLADILRRLVVEEISIRDFRNILMAIAQWGRVEKDPYYLTGYVRASLKRYITHKFSRGSGTLVVFLLDPAIEQLIRDRTRHTALGSYVELDPDVLAQLLSRIREAHYAIRENYQTPQLLTTMEIRSAVRRLVAPSLPQLHVLTYQELEPRVNIQPVGRVAMEGVRFRGSVKQAEYFKKGDG